MKTSNLNSSRRRLVSIAALLIALFVLTVPMMAQLVIPTQTKAPANTDIQNSASATYTYTDGTGTHAGSAVSNIVVTRVTPVYALDHLGTINNSTAQSVTGVQNTQVQFPHVIENLSNITDSYTIAVTNPATGTALTNVRVVPDLAGAPDLGYGGGTGSLVNTPVINSVVPGAAVKTYNFWVVGRIPVGATAGAVDVRVTSAGTGAPNKTVRDSWTGVQASILSNLTKAMPTNYGLPNTSGYAVNLSYVNSTYKSGVVIVTDTLPAGMTYEAGSGRWSGLVGGTAPVPEVDAATFAGNTWPVGQTSPKVKMNVTGNVVKYAIEYVDANAAGTITFNVGIAANATPGSTLANTANFSWDDGTGNTVTGSTGSVNFFVERSINVNLWNSGGAAGGSKNEIKANVAEGTTQVDFPMVIQNLGNMSDNIGLSAAIGTFPAGTTFQYLDATNNQITAAGVPVAAGASVNVTVRAFLQPGPYGTGPFIAPVTASSKTAGGLQYVVYTQTSDNGTARLTTILGAGVDITVDQSLAMNPAALGVGIGPEVPFVKNQPGTGLTTTTFMLYVNNTAPAGGPQDSYTLTAGNTTAANAFNNGFSVTFFRTSAGACTTTAITSTNAILANSSELVCATVTFPNGTSTAPNSYPVYFAAKSVNFTHPLDVNHDQVTIGNYRNVTFTPAVRNSSAAPGGSTTYSHTVTNSGNVIETISFADPFTTNSLAGWTSSVDYNGTTVTAGDIGPLAAGASMSFTITVTAPTNATVLNQTTTTVTYTNGGASLTASVQDNTSVSGYVVLRKYLYIDAGCAKTDFTTGVTWTQPDSGTPASVAPGGCIFYKVTAQNLGSSAITSVNITDGMQQYTTLQTTPAASCSDPSGACATFSASQASGISASFATLNPNDLVTIYYAVKVAN